jgi:integrase
MPTMTFTTRELRALKPGPERVDYWSDDPKEPGFGLRIFPSGVKSWFLFTRQTKTGQAVRVTLGTFPALKLEKARTAAEDKRADVRKGTNPADEHREARRAQRETVKALFESYAQDVELRRQAGGFRSWPDVKRAFERDVLPVWGDRPVREIERKDVSALVTAKALVGRTAANRLQAYVSMLCAYGVEQGWLGANPVSGLKRRHKEQPRTRVLKADELRTLWQYLDGDDAMVLSRGLATGPTITMPPESGTTIKDVFKVLLLSGQRLRETSRMTWADVDLDAARWIIPGSETKNGREHTVPLAKPVIDLLTRRYESATSSYVFPSRTGSEASVLVWTKRAAAAMATATKIAFTAHDCRRTVSTGLGELGISGDVIGLILNHTKPGVVGRHYDHSTREAAKAEALTRWAARLQAIVTGTPAKVVPMLRKRAR